MSVPQDFSAEWEAAWNAHDLPRILSHYAEDVVFHSAKAAALVGQGRLQGKPALESYWRRALDAQPDLAFVVREVFWGHDMLVILYTNHKGVRAAETLRFGSDGQVVEASACHGVVA